MDKNTIIGLLLILAVIFGFNYFNRPSKEEVALMKHRQDSLALVQQQRAADQQAALNLLEQQPQATVAEMIGNDTTKAQLTYGHFAANAMGEKEIVSIENDVFKLRFSTQGGGVESVELKEYSRYDSLPIILFDGKESVLDLTLTTTSNRVINTRNLYFTPIVKTLEDNTQILTMRLAINEDSYLDYVYTIAPDNYMMNFDIVAHQMQNYLDVRNRNVDVSWKAKIRQQEKGRVFEDRYARMYYKFASDGSVESLNNTKDDDEQPVGRIKWVAFKDQFFSSILIADSDMESVNLKSVKEEEESGYLKDYSLRASLPLDATGAEATKLRFYFGPNQFNTLNAYDKGLKKDEELNMSEIIPLGSFFLIRWVNRFMVIPMFNLFGSFIGNYGLIILLMTLVIKLVLLPFTYKSYMSTAKMRVLKPQIDEINAKIPKDKAMERQQATMALYKKVGVSPMGGCLPMMLQMPILFAMFRFFPTAIELRQQGFLWATDLSSYDAILTWSTQIPIISSVFGNHLSLFCLLMTVTNIIYTRINMKNNPSNQQMAGMSMIMYLMPLMFLFMFNNYAAGLSYYYFISLLITIGQTYLFRLFVNDDKLLAQLEAKKGKKKNPKKKSGFMARLEDAQRRQQKMIQEQKKKNNNSKGH